MQNAFRPRACCRGVVCFVVRTRKSASACTDESLCERKLGDFNLFLIATFGIWFVSVSVAFEKRNAKTRFVKSKHDKVHHTESGFEISNRDLQTFASFAKRVFGKSKLVFEISECDLQNFATSVLRNRNTVKYGHTEPCFEIAKRKQNKTPRTNQNFIVPIYSCRFRFRNCKLFTFVL